jgi:hypothetical protein
MTIDIGIWVGQHTFCDVFESGFGGMVGFERFVFLARGKRSSNATDFKR